MLLLVHCALKLIYEKIAHRDNCAFVCYLACGFLRTQWKSVTFGKSRVHSLLASFKGNADHVKIKADSSKGPEHAFSLESRQENANMPPSNFRTLNNQLISKSRCCTTTFEILPPMSLKLHCSAIIQI